MSSKFEERGVAFQIPRNSLALLMVAQAIVVLPHAWQLPPWIIAAGLFFGFWRTMVYQGRWDYPRQWVKALLVLTSGAAVAISARYGLSLEAASSLLIIAFALKLIEMKSRRDAYIVIYLCYFTIATEFLFNQSIAIALYGLGAFVVVTAAMIGLNQLHTDVHPLRTLRVSALLVVQALPLMVVLFLFFPRIAPLWSVPLPNQATTGISDVVTPGDIANLVQSDAIVLRAVFDGPVPPPASLYWRGMVYSDFEAGTWRAGAGVPGSTRSITPFNDEPSFRYVVLQEPNAARWLFALHVAAPATAGIRVTQDFRLIANDPLHSVQRYEVRSYPDLRTEVAAPAWLKRELSLPSGENPRIREFAASLSARSAGPKSFIEAVLRHIREQPYRYTLEPGVVTEPHSIDKFWFDTRNGFCSHYASAVVFMARSIGIPARLIGGYQGGELNPMGNHLVVRQYDAHAWAEIWLANEGWVRVDPTAAVAPGRIERGLAGGLPAEELASLSPFSTARLGDVAGLRDLLHLLDSIEHRWTMWVVGYDTALQTRYLTELLGKVTPLRIGIALVIGGCLSMLLVAATLVWRRGAKHQHPAVRAFCVFARRLERFGVKREPSESPAAFVTRVATDRGIAPHVYQPVVENLNRLLYNPGAGDAAEDLKHLKRKIRTLQLQLALSVA